MAYVLAATYASVFLALAFLLLHFGVFWGAAVWQPRGRLLRQCSALGGVLCALLGLGLVGGLCSSRVPTILGPAGCGSTTGLGLAWQDLPSELRIGARSYTGLQHLFFYHLYVIETLGLNLIICFGLAAALVILSLRGAGLGREPGAAAEARGGRGGERERLRVVAHVRRQTRRANTTRLRSNR